MALRVPAGKVSVAGEEGGGTAERHVLFNYDSDCDIDHATNACTINEMTARTHPSPPVQLLKPPLYIHLISVEMLPLSLYGHWMDWADNAKWPSQFLPHCLKMAFLRYIWPTSGDGEDAGSWNQLPLP